MKLIAITIIFMSIVSIAQAEKWENKSLWLDVGYQDTFKNFVEKSINNGNLYPLFEVIFTWQAEIYDGYGDEQEQRMKAYLIRYARFQLERELYINKLRGLYLRKFLRRK